MSRPGVSEPGQVAERFAIWGTRAVRAYSLPSIGCLWRSGSLAHLMRRNFREHLLGDEEKIALHQMDRNDGDNGFEDTC